MFRGIFNMIVTVLLTMFALLIMNCQMPSPDDPANTSMTAVFRSMDSHVYESSIIDSVGKPIDIGAALYLPENFDSISLIVKEKDSVIFDTTFTRFNDQYFRDTVWCTNTFSTPGIRNLTLIPFSSPQLQQISTNFAIFSRQGEPATYSVEYKKSADVSGNVPIDNNRYHADDIVTIAENSGNLARDGHTFIGWNTSEDGRGTAYSAGTNLTIKNNNVVLFAQWTNESTYKIIYDGNGNTGGVAPIDANKYIAGAKVTVKTNSGLLIKDGFAFSGWNTTVDGKGTAYTMGSTFEFGNTDITLYAQWEQRSKYTVTYNGNANTAGAPPSDAGKYENGAVVTIKDNTGNMVKAGFSFAGWNTAADGSGNALSAGSTLIINSTDVTLYARWTQQPVFTVTYNGNTNTSGTVPVDPGKYESGTIFTVRGNTGNLVRTGFTFAGWNTDADGSGNSHAEGDTFRIGTANVTLYAQWAQHSTLSVMYNGNNNAAGIVPSDTGKYESGATVTVKENTGNLYKTGYTFVGWNTATDGSGTEYAAGSTFIIGSENILLYAHWKMNQYIVKFNSQGGSKVDSVVVNYGEHLSKPLDPTRSGYEFGGWYKEYSCANIWNFTIDVVTSSFTLYAKWPESNYLVNYNLNGGINGNNPTGYNVTSSSITLEDPIKNGYTFGGWYTNSSFTGSSVTTIPSGSTGDKVFWAKWTLTNFSITYNLNSGTNGNNPSSYTITSPEITFEEPTRNGYNFGGWYTSSNLTGTVVTMIPSGSTGDREFWAKWTLDTYSITYNLNGGINGNNPGNFTITSQAITLEEPTRNGYDFGGWYTNSNLSGTAISTIPAGTTGDKTFWAKWTATNYTIKYNLNNGTNGNNPTNYTIISSTITLAEPTRNGYDFGGWYTNSSLTGIAVTTIASGSTGNKEFWAKWNTIECTVNFITNGGTTIANQIVISGSNLQVPTSTRSGLTLVGWYREAGFVNLWNFSAPVTNTMTLYAKWQVQDTDGNVYDTVRIGNQTWMVQNLRTTKFRNGALIFLASDSWDWESRIDAAYCWPNNSVAEGVNYGALYNGYAATNPNIAPYGWHVATKAEYEQLFTYVANDSKALMKIGAFPNATNASGFSGIGTPKRNSTGTFSSTSITEADFSTTYWWTSTTEDYIIAFVNSSGPPQITNYCVPTDGCVIRCVKD